MFKHICDICENKADIVPGALSIFCCKSKIDPNPLVIVMKHDSCHESTNQKYVNKRDFSTGSCGCM